MAGGSGNPGDGLEKLFQRLCPTGVLILCG